MPDLKAIYLAETAEMAAVELDHFEAALSAALKRAEGRADRVRLALQALAFLRASEALFVA